MPTLAASPAAAPPEAVRTAAAGWVVRLAGGAPPPEVLAAFESWLRAEPSHAEAFHAAATLWGSPALAQAAGRATTAGRLRRLCPTWTTRPALRLAAALALLLAAAQVVGLPALATGQVRLALADHATGTGQRRAVALEDGSRVTLDAASAIDADTTSQGQTVTLLRGAAYFEVQPVKPGQSFTVSAGPAAVRVVGTAFAVSREATATEIAVRRGVVAVWPSGSAGPPLEVKAGERLRLTAAGDQPQRGPATEDAFAWLGGRIQFHDRPLRDVVSVLERSFPGLILIPDRALAAVPVSGSYRLDDPEAVAASLATAVSARTLRLGDRLLLIL